MTLAGCRSVWPDDSTLDFGSGDGSWNELSESTTESSFPAVDEFKNKSGARDVRNSEQQLVTVEAEFVDGRSRISNAVVALDDADSAVTKSAPAGTGESIRAISLPEAVELAIQNSEFFVENANFLSPANPLLNNPQFAQSRYDLDLQKSSREGVEAALADFEMKFTSGFQWGNNSVIQGNNNSLDSRLLVSDNGTFYGRLDKPLAAGGIFSVIHNLNYASTSQSIYVSDPRYSGFLRGEFRQPLLAGRGRAFTEIAGPLSYRSRKQNNGVALADIAERSAEIDFEMGLDRIQQQVEELYWDCWFARQAHENQQVALRNAEQIWKRIQNRAETGLTGGGAADEAQAEENFYRRKSLADSTETELEQATERLTHLLGLPNDNGELLIPSDSPLDAPVVFQTDSSISNALANRQELARQDLQIQAIEYQMFAAKQLHRPQLDLVSGVQLNGLGDDLFGSNTGALADLTNTDDVGWNVGVEFSMPVGFQREKLNIRYLRLLMTKALRARALQEKEIEHEIVYTAKTVERWNQALDSARQRLAASERRLAAVEAEYQVGRIALDLLLRSQDSVAEAQVEVARAKAEVAKAQLDFLRRQGHSVQFQ